MGEENQRQLHSNDKPSEIIQDGTPPSEMLPLLQEQAVPKVQIQPWCT